MKLFVCIGEKCWEKIVFVFFWTLLLSLILHKALIDAYPSFSKTLQIKWDIVMCFYLEISKMAKNYMQHKCVACGEFAEICEKQHRAE